MRALSVVAPLVAPAGTVLLDNLSSQTNTALLTSAAVAAAPGWGAAATAAPVSTTATPLLLKAAPPNWTTDPQAPVWLRGSTTAFPVSPGFLTIVSQFFEMESSRLNRRRQRLRRTSVRKPPRSSTHPENPPLAAALPDVQAMVVAALDPTKTLAARAGAQLLCLRRAIPCDRRLQCSSRSMSLALTPQQLLPGVDTVPYDVGGNARHEPAIHRGVSWWV